MGCYIVRRYFSALLHKLAQDHHFVWLPHPGGQIVRVGRMGYGGMGVDSTKSA